MDLQDYDVNVLLLAGSVWDNGLLNGLELTSSSVFGGTIPGHSGILKIYKGRDGRHTAILFGRRHFYESRDEKTIIFQLLKNFPNLETLIVGHTGGLMDQNYPPGTLFHCQESLNFQRLNFSHTDSLKDYRKAPSKTFLNLPPGIVVTGFYGPTYQTPAECVFFKRIYGKPMSVVGMSPGFELLCVMDPSIDVICLSYGVLYTPDLVDRGILGNIHNFILNSEHSSLTEFYKQIIQIPEN